MTLDEVNAEIARLTKIRDKLAWDKRKADSAEFIRVNKIRRSEVVPSDGDGIPWHGMLPTFMEWISKHNEYRTFPWLEWNGSLRTNPGGRETPATYEDVPE